MGDIGDHFIDLAIQQHLDSMDSPEIMLDTWTQLDGKTIKIVDMTNNHLHNTINMLNRNNPESRYLPILKQELKNRK